MSVLLVFRDPTWIKFLFNSHLNLGLSFRGLKQSIYLLNRAQDAQLIAFGRLAPLCSIFRLSTSPPVRSVFLFVTISAFCSAVIVASTSTLISLVTPPSPPSVPYFISFSCSILVFFASTLACSSFLLAFLLSCFFFCSFS